MSSSNFELRVNQESWPLKNPFRIARGSLTEAHVIVATISDGQHTGRGEAVPSARYGQTVESATAQLEQISSHGPAAFDRRQIQELLPPGAARNALDCALWDLEAKVSGKRVWELANTRMADAVETAFTISLDTPEKMAAAAKTNANTSILKLKLGGDHFDLPRVEAVRQAASKPRLIVDANESWSPAHYRYYCFRAGPVRR